MSTAIFHFDNSYHRLPRELFADVSPTPVAAPKLAVYNTALAQSLGLPVLDEPQATAYFSGNQLIEGSEPIAQAYAGHQFGHPTMLGDGRCVLLGEQITPSGERFDVQLKGAGHTPFSRGGDGRAALAPMLREYLISEAMAALRIPTTRSLAVVTTGEIVQRETPLPGAILTRVAASHIRVGTFQYAAWHQNPELLPALFQHVIARHYPVLQDAANPALALLDAVMQRQSELVVNWLRVGFVHGVLNTDNVALSGESIDFGPCAFMDAYDPATVFSSIDRQGRYAFGNQPTITQWNLARFAETLLPLIDKNEGRAIELAKAALHDFTPRFDKAYQAMMRAKLGLVDEQEGDAALIADWLALLQSQQMDYTNAHRALMQSELPQETAFQAEHFRAWQQRWQPRHLAGGDPAKRLMQISNPSVIPRNHRVNRALSLAEAGDMSEFHALLDVLTRPYDNRAWDDPFCQPPGDDEKVCQTFCGT